jgi:CPA2 family monovalent cation:H+ antiporter-2
VVIGSGRAGGLVVGALARRGFSFVVISEDRHDVERMRERGRAAIYGDATAVDLLEAAHVGSARILVVAIPDAHAARLIVERARDLNPDIDLVVRAHDTDQLVDFARLGGSVQPIVGEVELGVQMTRYTLRRFGVSAIEAEAIAQGLRGRAGQPWPLEADR